MKKNIIRYIKLFPQINHSFIAITLWTSIISTLTVSLSAATIDDLIFTPINDGTEYSVSGVWGVEGDLVIPSTYEGKMVTEITGFHQSKLTSVTIPSSVKHIRDYAFYIVPSLETVTFEPGVESLLTIGASAFQGCSSLREFRFPSTVTDISTFAFGTCFSLQSVVLPENITVIHPLTFTNCIELSSVILPSKLKHIGDSAFKSSTQLKSIKFPDTLETIGVRAFYATGLTSVSIPASVTSFGAEAFAVSKSIESMTFLGPAPIFGEDAILSIGFRVDGATLNIFDIYEDSFVDLRNSFTFIINKYGSLIVNAEANLIDNTLSFICQNPPVGKTLNFQHKANIGEDWTSLPNDAYIESVDETSQAVSLTIDFNPNTQPKGFYRFAYSD